MADSWIYTTLSYGGLEFVTFVLVDAVVKSPLRDAANDGEKRTIWLYESVGLGLISLLVYILHHVPYLLIVLSCITFVYTQLLSRTDLTHIVADLRAHWENHLQHEESMKQLEHQKYLQQQQQQQQQSLGIPNFATAGINNLSGQNVEQNYAMGFPFLNKHPSLQYPPNATVVPGQDTPAYSLNPSMGVYRDGVRQQRGIYTSYSRSWNNVATTNYSAVDAHHALPVVTNATYDSSATAVQNINSNGRQFLWSDQNLPRRSLHPDINTKILSKPLSSSIKSKVMNMVGYGPSTLRPVGLVNYGQNVCFINSVLQCLARGPYLVENLTAVAAKELECSVFESQLLSSLTELLDNLTAPPDASQHKALSVNKFCVACSHLNPQLVMPPGQHMKQQDAAEFLMWLLAVLHGILNKNRRALDSDSSDARFSSPRLASLKLIYGDLSQSRVQDLKDQCTKDISAANGLENDSYAEPIQILSDLEWLMYKQTNDTLIDSLFTGQLVEVYHDVNHGNVSVNLQTFNVLPVPIDYPGSYSGLVMLDDCFARFCNVENINEPVTGGEALRGDHQEATCGSGVLRNRNLHLKGSAGGYSTPPNFRLAKGSDLAYMPSPIHPSIFPASLANTFVPQTPPTFPTTQSVLRANVASDNGFLDSTFRTSTPVGKDSAASRSPEKTQRRCLLRQLPECLIIQLMRFRYDNVAKLPTKVTTSVSIRLREFNLRDLIYDNVMRRGDLSVSDAGYVYELYGLCLHLGADCTSHGHYISYCLDQGRWYRMDDQNVVEVNMDYQLNTEEVRQNAYLLFYRRTV